MTAPVVKSNSTMSFILPSTFASLSDVPEPTSPDVTVAEVPPAYGAVATFSGWAPQAKAEAQRDGLLKSLKERGFERSEGAKWEVSDTATTWTNDTPHSDSRGKLTP